TVAEAATTATFTVTTIASIIATTPVTITAQLGTVRGAVLTVQPGAAGLSSLTVTPSAVSGPLSATGTVTFGGSVGAGGASVSLSTTNTSVTSLPSSVMVNQGQASASFEIKTKAVTTAAAATISAVFGGVTKTAPMTVNPCTTPIGQPPASFPTTETVWFDDAPPAGASLHNTWLWDTTQKASGTQSTVDPTITGRHEHYFDGATATLTPAEGDLLFIYAYVDPCNPPKEIMIGWNDGNWDHHAVWGDDIMGDAARWRVGDVPVATGNWIRLEVAASLINLSARPINGIGVSVYGGRVWFDRAGKASCTAPVATPPTSFPSGDSVFVDDSIPPGAVPTGTWNWDTTQYASGTQSFRLYSTTNADVSFDGASTPMTPAAGDKLFVYVMVDPCEPPKEILVRWSPISSAFRGARWGDDLLAYGTGSDRVYSGRVPQGGSWVRLEVPASAMNAVGVNLTGLAVSVYGGRAWFDRAGKTSCTTPIASAPSFGANEVIWIDDNLPTGADTHGTSWTWDTTQKASGAQSTTRPSQRGYSQRWFDAATTTLTVNGNAGDELFAYVLIDPCDPPLEIMIGWADPNWSHWAYWGEDLINQGTSGTSRFYMGPLPASGQWVKLTMPVATMGFTGAISGFNISMYSGKACFDRIGKNTGGFAALRRRGNEPQYASLPSMASSGETPPTLTRYSLYAPELNLLAETQLTASATPAIQYEYAWFGGQPVAQFIGTTTYWTFNDHLGTPVLQTDSSGAVDWRAEHEPYGKIYKSRISGNAHQPLRFPGQEDEQLDSGGNGATDRRYNIFRWYRSAWGRFTQVDPIGVDGLGNSYSTHLGTREVRRSVANAYAYVNDSPTATSDPSGQRPVECRLERFRFDRGDPQFPDYRREGLGRWASVCTWAGLCEDLSDRFIAVYQRIDRPPCGHCEEFCEGIFDSENRLPPTRVRCWDRRPWFGWFD
ncbi:MAG: RHS domain-containing protein, partial [Acidobacteriota bacterium]|nr:RHS domain-containing protein [Acidobacteriota bacterium]